MVEVCMEGLTRIAGAKWGYAKAGTQTFQRTWEWQHIRLSLEVVLSRPGPEALRPYIGQDRPGPHIGHMRAQGLAWDFTCCTRSARYGTLFFFSCFCLYSSTSR